MNLKVGENLAWIKVTAEDGSTLSYGITVVRESSDASIKAWTAPTYSTSTVGSSVSSLKVNVTVADGATWKLYRELDCTSEITDKTMLLEYGPNYAYIRVTAQNGNIQTYLVTVTREGYALSSACEIASWNCPSSDNTSGPWSTAGIIVNVTVSEGATWKLYSDSGCTTEIDKDMGLNVGSNTAYIKVTAEDNSTRVYPFTIIRAASSACDVTSWKTLSDPTVNGTGVTQLVPNATESQSIDVEVSPSATWELYSDNLCTQPIADKTMDLAVGINKAYLKVTAQDGTATQVYTVTITREEASSACEVTNWDDTGFVVSGTTATKSVPNTLSMITIYVQVSEGATWKLYNNSYCTSLNVDKTMELADGTNTAYLKVTAQDGTTTKVYTVIIIKGASASTACDITAWVTPVNPTVSGTTVTKTVDNATTSMVVGVSVSSNATWNLYSNSDCTTAIADKTMNLAVGANTAYIKVTAQDGTTTQVYTLTITREATATPPSGGSGTGGSNNTGSTFGLNDITVRAALNHTGAVAAPILVIPVGGSSVSGQISGQLMQEMSRRDVALEIKTDNVSYTLPTNQLDALLGNGVDLSKVAIQIDIHQNPGAGLNAHLNQNQALIGTPIEFSMTCTYNGVSVPADRFNTYVERQIMIPSGINPSSITTGIVFNSDGTFRHVPTIILTDSIGRLYARINSLTNSTYSVIYNPVEFSDVADHWAKDSINNMGSRLVISGIGNNCFDPNRDITRAEFSAIVVRALGLPVGEGENPTFTDVHDGDWSYGYIQTAVSYGLINGYNSTTFGGNDQITREQAMTIIARAMKLTKLTDTLKNVDADSLFKNFSDASSVSDYATASIAACLESGLVKGSNGMLNPKTNITRAETAVIVERLLTASELI